MISPRLTLFARVLLALSAFCAVASASDLTLRYSKPAPDTPQGWEREALPIGNGRIGAMLFGGLAQEHVQFNDVSLWSGDAQMLGAHQAFGELFRPNARRAPGFRRTVHQPARSRHGRDRVRT
jgi:alpha-L-fucosidase 2